MSFVGGVRRVASTGRSVHVDFLSCLGDGAVSMEFMVVQIYVMYYTEKHQHAEKRLRSEEVVVRSVIWGKFCGLSKVQNSDCLGIKAAWFCLFLEIEGYIHIWVELYCYLVCYGVTGVS